MPTQLRAIVDKLLSNVSQKIVPEGYIAEMILPMIPVTQFSGLLGGYSNDHLRISSTITSGKTPFGRIDVEATTSDGYKLQQHGLSDLLTIEDFANFEQPFDARVDSVDALTTKLWLQKESELATVLGDSAVLTNGVALTGNDRWDVVHTDSNPIQDINTGQKSIQAATGRTADTLIVNFGVFQALTYHPTILDRLGFKHTRVGQVTAEELAKVFNLKRVLIGLAVFNDSVKGQSDNIVNVWGNFAVLAVAPTQATKRQVSLGYRLQKSGTAPRQVFKHIPGNPPEAEEIMVRDVYEQLITNVGAAYLIKTAIS